MKTRKNRPDSLPHAGLRYATAVQQINYPEHNGRANPWHGMFFFVGSVPAACCDEQGGSKIYPTEDAAIRAAIAAGAVRIQGADCRLIDPASYC